MIVHGVPGGWRLWRWLFDSGALSRTVEYEVEGSARSVAMRIPLYRAESSWSKREVAEYSRHVVMATLRPIAAVGLPVALIDCGADIGLVASSFIRECARICEVIAYEPNAQSMSYLMASAEKWGVPVRAHNVAVSDHSGRGRLVAPSGTSSSHAMYIVEDADGPIEVKKVDDDPPKAGAAVILKIDVEGAELAVIRGAMATLKGAPSFVVALEAHPRVVERCGVDPSEAIRLVQSIRPIAIEVAEFPGLAIDPQRPFFEQLGSERDTICNVICASLPL